MIDDWKNNILFCYPIFKTPVFQFSIICQKTQLAKKVSKKNVREK